MARKKAARPTVSRPRLADVARDAGVSTMTVVRVLRDPGKVAKSTRERVAASLDKTKYTPDLVARALVSRRSGIVGAVVPTLANSLIAEVMQGMTAELALHEQQLIVGASTYSARHEEDLVRSFLSRRVDAIYLTGTSHTPETVKLLKASGVPVVEGGNLPQTPIDLAVGLSNFAAAGSVVAHLLARYGTNLGFLGGSTTDNDRMRDRRNGFNKCLARAGIRPDPRYAIEVPISMAGGRLGIGALLALDRPPRAVFCATDVIAAGAVLECRRRSLDVPGDIAIAGYDDLDIASELVPSLTTVRAPRYEIGRKSAQLMHLCLTGNRPKQSIFDLGFVLMARESA
jgi:LacI family transcriptional regulator, gluconate utilization system Gnt-I transcriptional repressor